MGKELNIHEATTLLNGLGYKICRQTLGEFIREGKGPKARIGRKKFNKYEMMVKLDDLVGWANTRDWSLHDPAQSAANARRFNKAHLEAAERRRVLEQRQTHTDSLDASLTVSDGFDAVLTLAADTTAAVFSPEPLRPDQINREAILFDRLALADLLFVYMRTRFPWSWTTAMAIPGPQRSEMLNIFAAEVVDFAEKIFLARFSEKGSEEQ